jgi:tRNA (guanine37-N1)-methyltransferase
MVMRPDVVDAAIAAAKAKAPANPQLIYLSPRGQPLTQSLVKTLVNQKNLIILCGRFEGVDQRVLDFHEMMEISIGDYVLSGGEVAAITLLDACIRLLPGVVGGDLSEESFGSESEFSGLLEYPHYTRPAVWQGMNVPEVLTSGHHANITAWRRGEAEKVTRERRPDLWSKR